MCHIIQINIRIFYTYSSTNRLCRWNSLHKLTYTQKHVQFQSLLPHCCNQCQDIAFPPTIPSSTLSVWDRQQPQDFDTGSTHQSFRVWKYASLCFHARLWGLKGCPWFVHSRLCTCTTNWKSRELLAAGQQFDCRENCFLAANLWPASQQCPCRKRSKSLSAGVQIFDQQDHWSLASSLSPVHQQIKSALSAPVECRTDLKWLDQWNVGPT